MDAYTLPVRVEHFISMIKRKPAIWNVNKNKFGRQEAWSQIMNELYPDFETWDSENEQLEFRKKVVKKWTQIRDSYVKSERRKLYRTEAERERHRPYIYSDYLTFLKPVLSSIKTMKTSKKSQKSDTTDSEDDHDVDPNDSVTSPDNQPFIKVEYIPNDPIEQVTIPQKRLYRHCSDDSSNVKVRVTEPSTSTSALNDSAETHMSFFKGIIPSLESFDVDQVLEFQMGVLKLVKQIRNK